MIKRLVIALLMLAAITAAGVAAVFMTVPGAALASSSHHHKTPTPYVFWFTQLPQRLEPFECQVVPQFSRDFNGLQVRVCVPYFLNWPPTPDGRLPVAQRIMHP